nr:MAG TPA: hypothetical protein [Caudoviricetes sp.]
MSTRARIGVRLPDGTIKSVHIWRDGHPDTLGETLSAHYNTLESAMALVERGNIIDVEARLEECRFEQPNERYDTEPRIYKTVAVYEREIEEDICYKYLYRDGKWEYRTVD